MFNGCLFSERIGLVHFVHISEDLSVTNLAQTILESTKIPMIRTYSLQMLSWSKKHCALCMLINGRDPMLHQISLKNVYFVE